MFIEQIIKEVSAVKPVTKRQVYRYMKTIYPAIRRIGCRQRPQPYPDDSAERIKRHLGIKPTLSMPQLRDQRRRAEKARKPTNGKPTPRNGNGSK